MNVTSLSVVQCCTYTVHIMCHVEDNVAPFDEISPGQTHDLEGSESQSQLVNNNNKVLHRQEHGSDQSSASVPAAS